ncbi:uncharacterized protein LOC128552728 [Mercenaria mercenaria]|uniref:uncharacterized protein LOC128552728 n=1 Tax=Mercenaria mercenaria TaxID=6596 RepID=UPI00234FB027|nr:uncharacterized protein LOC128552728 [Mercenaria mercenaria]XP_053389759.1 uncharacterized protein LOC128552728 [Mercenaria mercenaria]
MMCCDDKAKVPVGDPGVFISTGVRGKKTLAPVSETLEALDHDMTKSSLCPSVYLECEVPMSIEKSFVRGQVNVVVNDSVFQSSNPFRHAAIVCDILAKRDPLPKVFLRFSDGGTDQRNTLESVKCAAICIFKEMNLDMLILGRCAPGHSWVNPAERIMSILNLGLQNCALERGDDDAKFKSCNSMAQIREHVGKHPDLKPVWEASIGPVQKKVEERFQRLKLKDIPFRTFDPVSDENISILQRHLRELFPEMDLTKLQKTHTKTIRSYQAYLETHCRQRHYTFQIRKCNDENCCIPPTVDRCNLTWLPDPILDGEHYKTYSDMKDQDTTEEDRPTYRKTPIAESKVTKKPKGNLRSAPLSLQRNTDEPIHHDASIFTAQNARSVTDCCECRKPRVIYSKHKLTERQMVQVSLQLSEFDYTCGSYITTPANKLHGVIYMRTQLSCIDPVELAFYSSEVARKDLCCFCATPEAEISSDLKKQYKTVLPICPECVAAGNKPICQRPYKTGLDKPKDK